MTLTVLVPSSVCREAEDKRAATRKLGYVARAAAVFRADRLVVFPDREGEGTLDGGFVRAVLRYAATPPYLRKDAFGRRDELEYVGVLPPLGVPSWTGSESTDSGSKREGIVTQVGPEGRVRVNCGLQHPVSLRVAPGTELAEGERVTVRVSSRRPVRAKLLSEPPPGFRVESADLADALDGGGVRVATSRHGAPLTVEGLAAVTERIEADGATVAFGAPGRGLPDILGVDPEAVGDADAATPDPVPGGFDAWLNAIPNQGTEVVRTEEALFAVLGCLNLR
jgi:predicted SPOUT superfamily RNA methylase MTH1